MDSMDSGRSPLSDPIPASPSGPPLFARFDQVASELTDLATTVARLQEQLDARMSWLAEVTSTAASALSDIEGRVSGVESVLAELVSSLQQPEVWQALDDMRAAIAALGAGVERQVEERLRVGFARLEVVIETATATPAVREETPDPSTAPATVGDVLELRRRIDRLYKLLVG